MNAKNIKAAAVAGYGAYVASIEGESTDGDLLPKFKVLTAKEQRAWEKAAIGAAGAMMHLEGSDLLLKALD
jgi:hypothetical protein